jgi:uncharacterized glyoxalase superfamily protein PhnB
MTHAATTPTLQSATPVFLVGDIAATMRWYRDALGFAGRAVPETPPHNFAILQRDGVVVFFQQLTGYERPDVYRQRDGGVWSAYIRTDGVESLYATLKARPDVTIVKPLRRQPYGQTEFEVRDPNGYVLVFAER